MSTPTPEDEVQGTEAGADLPRALDEARYHTPHTSDELTARNVDTVIRLEREVKERRTGGDRVIDGITAFCGSIAFVWVHVVWFAAWIGHDILKHGASFDPFPYQLLTLIVSLEAIILSTFILISPKSRRAP